jgi:hypothetical protein
MCRVRDNPTDPEETGETDEEGSRLFEVREFGSAGVRECGSLTYKILINT